ncbi:hypothetical protein, partial [Roseibium sp. RKSG952]|uniref:hypothetical protein n=1 Tax=Roseibium sp. RKSG952 TaxID=2529384 RepID=UPI001AD92A63
MELERPAAIRIDLTEPFRASGQAGWAQYCPAARTKRCTGFEDIAQNTPVNSCQTDICIAHLSAPPHRRDLCILLVCAA